MATSCYLVVQTDRQRLSLRRFGYGAGQDDPTRHVCPARERWHSGYEPGCEAGGPDIETVPLRLREDGVRIGPEKVDHDDPRWPAICDHCHEPFTHGEAWQENGDPIMRVTAIVVGASVAVGEEFTLRDLPPGAIWEAGWLPSWSRGFDGRGFICRLPDGHDWRIDGEASNCTRKGDGTHRCWIRDGEPPYLNVSKDGPTCAAGAGSIATEGYHGFLRDGVLT